VEAVESAPAEEPTAEAEAAAFEEAAAEVAAEDVAIPDDNQAAPEPTVTAEPVLEALLEAAEASEPAAATESP
jgi:hypothetical protein